MSGSALDKSADAITDVLLAAVKAYNRERTRQAREGGWFLPRNCAVCGALFTPSAAKHKTCGPVCHKRYVWQYNQRTRGAWDRASRTCVMCQRIFVPRTRLVVLCSPECRRRRIKQQWLAPKASGVCPICGRLFVLRYFQAVTKRPRLTCSKACRYALMARGVSAAAQRRART